MIKQLLLLFIIMAFALQQCKVIKDIQTQEKQTLKGLEGMVQQCTSLDTIHTVLIQKAEAILTFDNERYEVTITLYSKKDSIIYLSAVNSGYEIIRASMDKDSIKVISRLDKIVYRAPLVRGFGYQYPVNFNDLQNLITAYYLCDNLEQALDDMEHLIKFDMDEKFVKKRIHIDRNSLKLKMFEFYHQKTDKYLMGERIDDVLRIYSNFMITEFEVNASGGTVIYNQSVPVKMEINPRKYTYTELR